MFMVWDLMKVSRLAVPPQFFIGGLQSLLSLYAGFYGFTFRYTPAYGQKGADMLMLMHLQGFFIAGMMRSP